MCIRLKNHYCPNCSSEDIVLNKYDRYHCGGCDCYIQPIKKEGRKK